jgi:hypothetical protein
MIQISNIPESGAIIFIKMFLHWSVRNEGRNEKHTKNIEIRSNILNANNVNS